MATNIQSTVNSEESYNSTVEGDLNTVRPEPTSARELTNGRQNTTEDTQNLDWECLSHWEFLAQRRKVARIMAIYKMYKGQNAWKKYRGQATSATLPEEPENREQTFGNFPL
jgi:hypothetical protein